MVTMGAGTLVSMAQRACIRNIATLKDVGDISYDLLRPILKKIDNPQQLKEIEDASPHIADHDAELWKAFIMRDIPKWQEKMVEPKNPRSWCKVYRKLIREEERAKQAGDEALRAAMAGIKERKEQNQTQYVRKVIAEPTRQTAFVDGKANPNVRCLGTMVQVKKPTIKNAKTGPQILSALRKQSSNAQQHKGLIHSQPAKVLLPTAKSQIARAPESMVREHTKPAPVPVVRRGARGAASPQPNVFASREVPRAHDRAIQAALKAEQAQREERLRALASGNRGKATTATPAATSTSGTASTPAATTSTPAAISTPATISTPLTSTPPRRQVAVTPPRTVTPPTTSASGPAVSGEHRATLVPSEDARKTLSPSPIPSLVRKRAAQPPPSIFMPTKKRKV